MANNTDIRKLYICRDIRLTREGEVELARRIEASQDSLRDIIMGSPLNLRVLAGLNPSKRSGNMRFVSLPWNLKDGNMKEVLGEVGRLEITRMMALSNGFRLEDKEHAKYVKGIRHRQYEILSNIRINARFWLSTISYIRSVVSDINSKEKKFGKRNILSKAQTGLGIKKLELLLQLSNKFYKESIGLISEMVEANIPLGIHTALKSSIKVPIVDRVQECNLGLMRAAEKFDYRIGTKFSTYAIQWMNQAIRRFVNNNGLEIRVPVNTYLLYNKVMKARRSVLQRENRIPDEKELSKITKLPLRTIKRVLDIPNSALYLDKFVDKQGDGKGTRVINLIRDKNSKDSHEELEGKELRDRAERLLSILPRRERYVIRRRFGFDKEIGRQTLKEIGQDLGVSRERIRQIEADALEKLRRAERASGK